MTTIAIDAAGRIAWDSQTTSNDTRELHGYGKVRKIGKWVYAGAGDSASAYAFPEWFRKGMKPAKKPPGDWCVLVIKSPTEVYQLQSSHPLPLPLSLPAAIGSGSTIALTAMRCGKNATEAVDIACDMDIYTGRPVQSLDLHEAFAKKGKRK